MQEFVESRLRDRLPLTLDLAKTCLTYISFVFDEAINNTFYYKNCRRVNTNIIQDYKLARYAFQYWAVHTSGKAEECLDIQHAFVHAIQHDQRIKAVISLERNVGAERLLGCNSSRRLSYTILHLIAAKGLSTFCRLLLDGSLLISERHVYSAIFYLELIKAHKVHGILKILSGLELMTDRRRCILHRGMETRKLPKCCWMQGRM